LFALYLVPYPDPSRLDSLFCVNKTVLAIQAKKKRYKNSNKGKGRPREKETREEDSNKKDKRPTTKPTVR
jgi:hypothetical protein